jgi:hypothetical protein
VASTTAAGCRIEGAQDAKGVILDKAFAPLAMRRTRRRIGGWSG